MRVQFINPFLKAASEVLASELGEEPNLGNVGLRTLAQTTDEVTAVVRVRGAVGGAVLYSMSDETARAIVAQTRGMPCPELDAMARDGISELGNVITGRAGMLLAEAGYPSSLEPPQLVIGRGTLVSVVDLTSLVIPLESSAGPFEIQVVLSETGKLGLYQR